MSLPGGSPGFRCGPADTVLLAGLRAGWDLSYECASGGCGSCKAVLLDGEVECLWPDATGLTARDRRKGGRILLCQSRPLSDCTVRTAAPPARSADAVPPPSRRAARIAAVEPLGPGTVLLSVDCGRPMPYLAGQFVILELPDGTRRAYSMAREPGRAPSSRIEMLVREKPGGSASSWLFGAAAPGAPIVVEGPYGRAFVQSPADRPVVCVGGGSGLGPVLAIAERCLTEAPRRPVALFVGARNEEDVVLLDRLTRLHQRGGEVVVAVEKDDPDAGPRPWGPTRPGLVTDVLAAERADLTGEDVYAAGPDGMIDAFLAAFVRTGRAAADRVYFDRFVA
ncbi:MAG: 2Fe-2S iron-sulfur cluster-binding protein [Pseudonocardia sp.]